eukprot:TRINITY_DN9480_c0_g1_i4.p2 TRINITY_DN9480_c0_g1~~TRINITY_DN9480_c0_g1_i4.p2  ORF type:complete len:228 (-),score=32.12 TRINITY_DN9480_c0_g1_i4:111-794(-)
MCIRDRYCGARFSSNFTKGPWGPRTLCTIHYIDWNQKKKLNLDEYKEMPQKPIDLTANTELNYLGNMKSKSMRYDNQVSGFDLVDRAIKKRPKEVRQYVEEDQALPMPDLNNNKAKDSNAYNQEREELEQFKEDQSEAQQDNINTTVTEQKLDTFGQDVDQLQVTNQESGGNKAQEKMEEEQVVGYPSKEERVPVFPQYAYENNFESRDKDQSERQRNNSQNNFVNQ